VETYLFLAILFLFGAALGSFLNVAALRVAAGEQYIRGRSHCPACGKTLLWLELIPLVSFAILRGRCRSCGIRFSVRYFIVEFLVGAYAAGLGYAIIFRPEPLVFAYPAIFAMLGSFAAVLAAFLLYIVIGSVACVIFLIDYDTKLIIVGPLRLLAAAGILLLAAESWLWLGGGARSIFSSPAIGQMLLAALIALFFYSVWLITRGRGMGLGDAELAGGLALFLPYPQAIIMVLAAFWIGAAWGIGLILFAGYDRKSQIPFGPFIILGFVVALFWGRFMLSYLVPLI